MDEIREYNLKFHKLLTKAELWARHREARNGKEYESGTVRFSYRPGEVYKRDIPRLLLEGEGMPIAGVWEMGNLVFPLIVAYGAKGGQDIYGGYVDKGLAIGEDEPIASLEIHLNGFLLRRAYVDRKFEKLAPPGGFTAVTPLRSALHTALYYVYDFLGEYIYHAPDDIKVFMLNGIEVLITVLETLPDRLPPMPQTIYRPTPDESKEALRRLRMESLLGE